MSLSKFSQFNTPNFNVAPNIEDHPFTDDSPPDPCLLTRQTNEWINYFGKFPTFCARIVCEDNIQSMLKTQRHVAQIRLSERSSFAKREVMHNISRIIAQLEKLGVSWEKASSKIHIFEITLEFFVSDDTGYFHVIASHVFSEFLNQLICCIRLIFIDREPLSDFPTLTRDLWDTTIHLISKPDHEFVDFPD
jgi:hypothetical protein